MLDYTYCDPILTPKKHSIQSASSLLELQQQILNCHLCDCSKSRTQSMPGYGAKNADVVFVDYTISELQDSTNSYYSGRSGELLQKMIENMLHLTIEDVYLTALLKCKALPNAPLQNAIECCKGYFLTQLQLIQPKVIVLLGEESYYALFGTHKKFEDIRGHLLDFEGVKTIAMYHPSYLLRNPNLKKTAFYDLKTIKSCL